MTHTAAKVVQQLLIQEGVGANSGDWRTFVHNVTDEGDRVLFVRDGPNRMDGINQRTGEPSQHYGVQVTSRSPVAETGAQKLLAVTKFLTEQATRKTVAVDSKNYLVHSVQLVSSVLPLGQEEKNRRFLFSSNFAATIEEL